MVNMVVSMSFDNSFVSIHDTFYYTLKIGTLQKDIIVEPIVSSFCSESKIDNSFTNTMVLLKNCDTNYNYTYLVTSFMASPVWLS